MRAVARLLWSRLTFVVRSSLLGNWQVAFQHEELVTLNDKFVGQQALYAHDEAQRHRIHTNLCGVVLQQRQQRVARLNNNNNGSLTADDDLDPPAAVDFTPRKLKMAIADMRDVLEDDRAVEEERWRSGVWAHLTRARADDVREATARCRREARSVRHLLEEYRRHFPQLDLEWDDDDDIDDDDDDEDIQDGDDENLDPRRFQSFHNHPSNPHDEGVGVGVRVVAAKNDFEDVMVDEDALHNNGTHPGIPHNGDHHQGTYGGGGGGGYDDDATEIMGAPDDTNNNNMSFVDSSNDDQDMAAGTLGAYDHQQFFYQDQDQDQDQNHQYGDGDGDEGRTLAPDANSHNGNGTNEQGAGGGGGGVGDDDDKYETDYGGGMSDSWDNTHHGTATHTHSTNPGSDAAVLGGGPASHDRNEARDDGHRETTMTTEDTNMDMPSPNP
jgi:hypothetical protein